MKMEKAQALDVTELPSDLSFPSQGYLQFRPTALQFPVIAISILHTYLPHCMDIVRLYAWRQEL